MRAPLDVWVGEQERLSQLVPLLLIVTIHGRSLLLEVRVRNLSFFYVFFINDRFALLRLACSCASRKKRNNAQSPYKACFFEILQLLFNTSFNCIVFFSESIRLESEKCRRHG
jgi:hypothetical protein